MRGRRQWRVGAGTAAGGDPPPAVAAFVAALRAELAARGLEDAPCADRLVEEAAGHVEDRAADLHRAGHRREVAEELAVRRIGRPSELVEAWELHLAAAPAGRGAPFRWLRAMGDTVMTISNRDRSRWLKTAAWSAAGLLAGGALAIPAGRVAGLATMMLILPAIGAAVGLGLGLAQRRATRGRGVLTRRWWWASAAGMAVALTGGTALIEQLSLSKGLWSHDLLALALIGGSAGLVLSLAQSSALCAPSALKLWWVLGSAAGLALAFVVGGLAAYGLIGGIREVAGLAVLALVTSLAAGGATACVLEGVVRRADGGAPA